MEIQVITKYNEDGAAAVLNADDKEQQAQWAKIGYKFDEPPKPKKAEKQEEPAEEEDDKPRRGRPAAKK